MATHRKKGLVAEKGKPSAQSKKPTPKKTAVPQVESEPLELLLQRAPLAPDSLSAHDAERLQRSVGNQAVGHLRQENGRPKAGEDGETAVSPSQSSLTAIQNNSATIARQALPQVGAEGGELPGNLSDKIESARAGGRPMADHVRQPMEDIFQTDFSGVKIHTDNESAKLNRSISARAFTTDHDIFFSPGTYNPDTPAGKELLAHELTHVVQQNGRKPQASLIVSQPADREERDAEEVGRMVAKHGNAHEQAPLQTKVQNMKAAQRTVQRGFKTKVGLAIGKGVLMSFVKAIAGPLMFISKSQRSDVSRNWRAYGDREKYVNGHLERMGKASMVFQQIGALAGWISLLTGVGSLIAAAFAPAGLAASALLGSISAIAGLVAAGAGAVTFGLSTILTIVNLKRALALPKRSLQRRQLIIAAIKDGSAALSGLIAAVGGVVGAAMGGWQFTQSSSGVQQTLDTSGLTGLGKDLAIGSGAGQAFALSDEVQGEVGGVLQEDQQRQLRANPRFGDYRRGQQAMQQRRNLNQTGIQLDRAPLQRAPDDESGQEDYSSQVLQELNKVDTGSETMQQVNSRDQSELQDEQSALSTAIPDLEKADKGMSQARGFEQTEEDLKKIEKQSGTGQQEVESSDDLEKAEPQSKSEAESKLAKLQETDTAIDDLENKSGEKFGQKQSFFGKLKSKIKGFFGKFKRGAKKVGKLFASAFLNIKARLKAVFTKIKMKVAQFLIKVTGLKEPMNVINEELQGAKEAAPASKEGTQVALEGISQNDEQADALQKAVQEARETIQG